MNVGLFFGTVNKRDAQKALRICKQFCPDSRREELIGMLRRELEQHQATLNYLDMLEAEQVMILEQYGVKEKCSLRLRTNKLSQVLNDLISIDEKERWKG